jgi:hypothetical protein
MKTSSQEGTAMAASIKETRAIDAGPLVEAEETEVSDATRMARNSTLEELPGLVFGVMTVAYIIMSLAGLAP